MALRNFYLGSQGPYIYDDTSDAGMSEDQVATKADVSSIAEEVLTEDTLWTSLKALSSIGLIVRTGEDTFVLRSLEGTADQVVVSNPTGLSDNPTISLPNDVVLPGRLTCEYLTVNEIVYSAPAVASTHKIPITINSETYFLLLQKGS